MNMATARSARPCAPLLLLCTAACGSGPTEPAVVTVATASGQVLVSAPGAGTFRVRLQPTAGAVALPSFAVDPAALTTGAAMAVETSATTVTVRTAAATLRVDKSPLHLTLLDAQGGVLAEEAAPILFAEGGAQLSWKLAAGERVYGLGDKVPGLDRRGRTFRFWNTDTYGFSAQADPLYKSIPFLIVVGDGRAHGLFLDMTGRATIDVGRSDPATLSYTVERAPTFDLYLFSGPDPAAVLAAYTALTGRTPLPPRWALGYHQSRYSYLTEAEAREVVDRMRADAIPLDALWLDIDFQQSRAPFTVNPVRFPDLPGMVKAFAATGVQTVVITDPHIAATTGDPSYDSGVAGDHFIHAPGGGLYVAQVWPGDSVFPEFSLARSRAWWGGLYGTFVGLGVAGFWNDMNEPSVFTDAKTMPDATPHRLDDGRVVDHVTLHNAYGLLNTRATFEGLEALRPDERPFVLTRAAFAGSQRYAATWTGDNQQTWEHLALTIPQLASLGTSGYAFVGADVTGFASAAAPPNTACDDPELVAAWMELGALQPFFRNHATKDSCRREPWVYGDALEARIRAAVERRYRLLPYLYTVFEEASRTGLPVLRPLWLEYPADPELATTDTAFLVGHDLLVAPRLVRDSTSATTVTLPAGAWWDTATGQRLAGGGPVSLPSSAQDSLHLLARAGAIIPQQPVTQAASVTPTGALTLDVWPGSPCGGSLYLDDGKTTAYRRGALRRLTYACTASTTALLVEATSSGDHPLWWSSTEAVLHGVPATASVLLDGAPVTGQADATGALRVTIPGARATFRLAASW